MARILIIDDDDSFREMLCLTIEHLGHEVYVAGDGEEAQGLIQNLSFDLVITDIVMPDKDGLEVVIALHHSCPSLPVIAMSGGGRIRSQDYLLMAKQLGAKLTLEKPFTETQLKEALDQALPVHRAK